MHLGRPSSSVSPGDSHCQATARWALSRCFLSHTSGYKCPVVYMTESKEIPRGKAGWRPRGLFPCLFQLLREAVLQTCPESETPFLCCTLWDSSQVHHTAPKPFQLLAERDHFMFSEILAVPLCLLCSTYPGSLWDLDMWFQEIPYIPHISMAFPVLRRGLFHTSCRLCSCLDTWVG